jgi:antitoxin CcdA
MRMEYPHKLSRASADSEKARPQKRAVNVSINGDLLHRARTGGLNLSSILEAALEQRLRQQARERWLTENRAGVDAYNEQVEKHGVFSEGLRAF